MIRVRSERDSGMTPEQLAKLPRYATDYIRKLEMALGEAKKTLDEFCDNQTDSGVWYDELICDNVAGGPSHRKRFIQSDRISMTNPGQDELHVGRTKYGYEVALMHRRMRIIPYASNVIRIETGE